MIVARHLHVTQQAAIPLATDGLYNSDRIGAVSLTGQNAHERRLHSVEI